MTRTITTPAPGNVPARQAVAAGQAVAAREAVSALQLRQPMGRDTRSTHTRLVRREAHSSLSIVAGTLASVVIAGCLYSGTELVLELLGQQPLITAPSDVVHRVSLVNENAPAILLTVGLIVAVIAVLVLVALLPGRRVRHHVGSERASAAGVAELAGVAPDNEDVPASHLDATARIAPEAGVVANRFTVAKAIADAIAYDSLRPSLDPTVVIRPTGRVFDLLTGAATSAGPAPTESRTTPRPI